MSASDKKKLRKEQKAAQMTQRQQQAKKEAKKLRNQTIAFVLVIVLIFGGVLGYYGCTTIKNSGILQRNTTAVTLNDRELSSVTLNYFYLDAISNQYSSWENSFGDYTTQYLSQYFGLDIYTALDKQYRDEEKTTTWADYFVDVAIEDARATYAIYDVATANNYKLPFEAQNEYDGWIENYEYMAEIYGSSTDDVVESNYGPGSDFESWKEYLKVVITAQSYAADYAEGLTYDDETLREYEKDKKHEFNAYSFASYHLSYTKYPELGTKDSNDKVTYTDEQKKAALDAAKADAESLVAGMEAVKADTSKLPEVKEGEDAYLKYFDTLIAALKCNEGNKSAVSTKAEDSAYADLNENIRDWLANPERKVGDTIVIPNESKTTDADGKETTVVNGYYALYFNGINENLRPLANVRHLLVKFEGGKTDSEGNTTYTEEQKNKAKTEAEKLMTAWKENPTQEHFIELVKKNSDDSSASEGGLFENISPDDNYVTEFLDWSLDEKRQAGDCEIIETQYGYHLMYYVDDDEMTYRDLLISNTIKEADYTEWYEATVDKVTATKGDVSYLDLDYMIYNLVSSGY